MRIRLACLAVAILTFSAGAQESKGWPKEPDGFMGVPFGAGSVDADAVVNFDTCTPSLLGPGSDSVCMKSVGFGDGLTFAAMFLFSERSDGDGLDGVILKFDPLRYIDVRDILIQRYGNQAVSSSRTLQNLGGGEFESHELTWTGRRVSIELAKYSGMSLSEGHVIVATNARLKALTKEKEDAKRKAVEAF